MATEIIMPEMGEGIIEGTLTRWLVAVGDEVALHDPIAEIETDKVSTELTAETAGVILDLVAQEGQTLPINSPLAFIGAPGEELAARPLVEVEAQQGVAAGSAETPATESAATNGIRPPRISPLVGRIAAKNRVDLAKVPGSGLHGRITKTDILAYVENAAARLKSSMQTAEELIAPPAPTVVAAVVPAAPAAAGELLPLTNMRRAIAEHMVRSKQTSPHATTVFEFDFSAVAQHRKVNKELFAQDGAKLTFTVYIVAAIVQALKQNPLVNSEWTDKGILLKREINLGMAAAVADGLVVPVIKNADSYSLLGLARAINDLTQRARSKKLTHADLQGGSFSFTNHGTTGSLFATPIINQPQCGILGIGKIEKRVKVIDDAIAIRPLAYASFTFDHRILDGASADAFVSSIKETIETWG